MKKVFIAAAIIGTCGIASADSEVCNFSTDYNIDINEERVSFNKTDGDSFEFKNGGLIVNGKTVVLTKEQAQASQNLQQGARAMVPKIAEIAVEGAELGIKATTMVLTSLFGDDMEMQNDLIKPIEAMSEKIKQNISATTLNTEALEKSFEDAFDDEFSKVIETAAVKYSGKIVSNVISSIFSGDEEELKDFEFRMENLEKDIEVYVEDNAKELEKKAELLCGDMAALEAFDTQLEAVNGYPVNGLFHTDSDDGFNLNKLTINQ
jgi:hypothetical protein